MESEKDPLQGQTDETLTIFAKGWSVDVDGPGQRLVYYLKGCNMSCLWCANPEGLGCRPEMLCYPDRSDGPIDHVCPYGALTNKRLDRKKCFDCSSRDCVRKWRCPCLELVGTRVSPEEITRQAVSSRDMFGVDGGVTFGGGEATLQAKPLLGVVRMLKEAGIHTAVETNASTADFKAVAETVDLLICDFKVADDAMHLKMTGISNLPVLENLAWAIRNKQNLLLRIPLVGGANDSPDEMSRMTAFLQREAAVREWPLPVEILRMHHLGEPKYAALGLSYPAKNWHEPAQSCAQELAQLLTNDKITATTGG